MSTKSAFALLVLRSNRYLDYVAVPICGAGLMCFALKVITWQHYLPTWRLRDCHPRLNRMRMSTIGTTTPRNKPRRNEFSHMGNPIHRFVTVDFLYFQNVDALFLAGQSKCQYFVTAPLPRGSAINKGRNFSWNSHVNKWYMRYISAKKLANFNFHMEIFCDSCQLD
jgi:hypothetical protein